jgi:hypothetical protein
MIKMFVLNNANRNCFNNQISNTSTNYQISSKWSNDSFSSSNDRLSFDDDQSSIVINNLYGKCMICNDDATGNHYGVISCEPCKVNE